MKRKFFTYSLVQPSDYLYVIIEAPNCIEANDIAKSKAGAYFEGFSNCTCCSDRWTAHYTDEDSTEVPSIYGRPLTEYVIERPCDMSKEPGVIVYFLDGEKEYKWVADGKFWRLKEMPKREVTTKFYCFSQNNSGGRFYGPERVIIEALSCDDANRRAEDFDIYFGGRGDCSCCGDRWSRVDEYDGEDFPHIYGKPIEEATCTYLFTEKAAVVYYMDGTKNITNTLTPEKTIL